MRGIGKHTPPEGMQPQPADNTSDEVAQQAARWSDKAIGEAYHGGSLIHTESAREIAAWWQAPGGTGYSFAVFQSTGTIVPSFVADIEHELTVVTGDTWTTGEENGVYLRALLAYVKACEVQS